MLIAYLVTLIVGGVLIVLSLMGGDVDVDVDVDIDFDADVDVDFDADADVDADLDADADADAESSVSVAGGGLVEAWLPIASVRFWTFFAAFFGLTGTLLTALSLVDSLAVTAVLASAVGYASGIGMTRLMKQLKSKTADSAVREHDFVGAIGTALLRVAEHTPGKVRVTLKGRMVDLIAVTEGEEPIEAGTEIMVYGIDKGIVSVARRSDEIDSRRESAAVEPPTTVSVDVLSDVASKESVPMS